VSWLDLVVPLTFGAIWGACFIYQLRGRAILPLHDPEFDERSAYIIERGAPPRPRISHWRNRITRTAPTRGRSTSNATVHHEESDVNITAVLGFGAALIVAAVMIHLLTYVLFRYFESREGRRVTPEYPLAPRRPTASRPSRGCRPTREDLGSCAKRKTPCSGRTAGWTRTPASCGSRSTRRSS